MQFPLLFAILLVRSCYSLPTTPQDSRQENLKVDEPPANTHPHHLVMEHRGPIERTHVQELFDKLFTSKTMTAVDGMVSSVVNIAGGVVEGLGDFVVTSIDQLPKAIEDISSTVGEAVDQKREKVLIMVKGIRPEEDGVATAVAVGEAIDKMEDTMENSQFGFSLARLEDAFGRFLGKLVGATYNRADEINKAISQGIRRITGAANATAVKEFTKTSNTNIFYDIPEDVQINKLPEILPDEELNEI